MTDFNTVERSRTLGTPYTLYKFSLGTAVYAYTDGEEAFIVDSITYQPIPLNRDSVSTSGTLDKSAIKISVPHDTAIAELFRVFPPSEVVGLTIYQGHINSDEVFAIWAGRVLSCSRADSEATLSCEPINTSMKRPGLRVRDQYSCTHALYTANCGAVREDFTVETIVSSIDGALVTLPAGWNGSFNAVKFANGIFGWTIDGQFYQRQVLAVNAAARRLRVGGSLEGLIMGMAVSVSLGCNHQMEDCNMFGRINSFGGCSWIPKKNPIGFVNEFY